MEYGGGGDTWKLHDNPLRAAVVIVDAWNVFFNVFFLSSMDDKMFNRKLEERN